VQRGSDQWRSRAEGAVRTRFPGGPLLGDTFDFAKVLQQLSQGDEEGALREVETAYKLQNHGGDRRSDEARKAREDQPVNHSLIYGTGNADYIKARLHRDHPEMAAALDRGEYRSARAAAIEAGIIKPVPTIRLVDDIGSSWPRGISRGLSGR
jgi:hypothetical protein